jgi:hypothetical protein
MILSICLFSSLSTPVAFGATADPTPAVKLQRAGRNTLVGTFKDGDVFCVVASANWIYQTPSGSIRCSVERGRAPSEPDAKIATLEFPQLGRTGAVFRKNVEGHHCYMLEVSSTPGEASSIDCIEDR